MLSCRQDLHLLGLISVCHLRDANPLLRGSIFCYLVRTHTQLQSALLKPRAETNHSGFRGSPAISKTAQYNMVRWL